MNPALGILLALVALVAWGIADFLIQRSARMVGIVMTMFLIGAVATIGFLPFVISELFVLTRAEILLLLGTGAMLTIASLLDFKALKEGKMAVAEPIIGLETPFTVIFAVLIAHEHLTLFQALIVGLIFFGTILVATKRFSHIRGRHFLEKGALIAFLSAMGLAFSNFLVGESSQQISPVLAIWSVGVVHAAVCGVILFFQHRYRKLGGFVKQHPWTLLGQAVVDNIAWIAFAGAALFIPISIAAAISSGYVALAVLLGIFITREKLNKHQFAGIAFICTGIAVLSYFYG